MNSTSPTAAAAKAMTKIDIDAMNAPPGGAEDDGALGVGIGLAVSDGQASEPAVTGDERRAVGGVERARAVAVDRPEALHILREPARGGGKG